MVLRSHSAYPSIVGSFPIKRIDHSSFTILTAPVCSSSFFAKVVLPAPINPQIKYTIGFLFITYYTVNSESGVVPSLRTVEDYVARYPHFAMHIEGRHGHPHRMPLMCRWRQRF